METKKTLKSLGKFGLAIIFLYLAIFSVVQFYQGYMNIALVSNAVLNGISDSVTQADGSGSSFYSAYTVGMSKLLYGFSYMALATLMAFAIGYFYKDKE